MRTPFERHYVKDLAGNAHPDAVAAFNATRPVRRKYFPGAAGRYRPEDHYVVAPARWERTPEGKVWLGIFAHETGHAIDHDGRPSGQGRSIWMGPAIRRDRMGMVSRSEVERGALAHVDGEWALGRFPPGARAWLLEGLPGRAEATCFARCWSVGRMEQAIDAYAQARLTLSSRVRKGPPGEDARLQVYAMAKVNDYIGAVYDLERGGGHSRAYYRQFLPLAGSALTIGHAAEAFANAFVADVLEGTELLSFLVRSAAPHTHAAYRFLLRRIGLGLCLRA